MKAPEKIPEWLLAQLGDLVCLCVCNRFRHQLDELRIEACGRCEDRAVKWVGPPPESLLDCGLCANRGWSLTDKGRALLALVTYCSVVGKGEEIPF